MRTSEIRTRLSRALNREALPALDWSEVLSIAATLYAAYHALQYLGEIP